MSGARVLVTGGAGFIGSHFIRAWLLRHPSDEVVALDALTYAGSRARLADVEAHGRCRFLHGSICDPDAVRQGMEGCELVVHFAAETHVDRSITNAAPFLRTNVEGTHVLLEEAQRRTIRRLLHLSTDEVYGPVLEGAVDEHAPLSPRSPYAASKAAGDLLAQAFRATYGLPVVIARPTNIYGPWQFPEKLIPLSIANAAQGHPVPVYGDGRQRRGWLFIEDLCEALRLILEQGVDGEVYNIASGTEQENLTTVRMILECWGAPAELMAFVTDRPGHDRRYAMNDGKLRSLGWQPRTPFAVGLSKTVDWYRANAVWWQPLVRTLREDPYHWLNRSARSGAVRPSGIVA